MSNRFVTHYDEIVVNKYNDLLNYYIFYSITVVLLLDLLQYIIVLLEFSDQWHFGQATLRLVIGNQAISAFCTALHTNMQPMKIWHWLDGNRANNHDNLSTDQTDRWDQLTQHNTRTDLLTACIKPVMSEYANDPFQVGYNCAMCSKLCNYQQYQL